MNDLAKEQREIAEGTQDEIDALKTENPFESAGAKSAMVQSARNAKQVQQRYANMMGGNASAESLVSAQAATQEAVAGTAGDIAVGAEANKAAQLAQLRGEKQNQMNQAMATKQGSISEIGSGWDSFMGVLDTVGGVLEGVGAAKKPV